MSTKTIIPSVIISSENTKWFTLVFNKRLYKPDVLTLTESKLPIYNKHEYCYCW